MHAEFRVNTGAPQRAPAHTVCTFSMRGDAALYWIVTTGGAHRAFTAVSANARSSIPRKVVRMVLLGLGDRGEDDLMGISIAAGTVLMGIIEGYSTT